MQLVLTQHRWLRFGTFCAFYFAQGVPIGLLSVAIPAWLAEQGVSEGAVSSYLGVVTLPWALKLVTGPFMDRFTFLAMGFRRPWVIAAQGGLTLSFVALALSGDVNGDSLLPLIVVGFVINAFAATQDVAVDGMAIDVLPLNERGRANAFMAFGQRAGYAAFGALCGILLTRFGLAVAALACAATLAAIFSWAAIVRERSGERVLPWTAGDATPREDVASTRLVVLRPFGVRVPEMLVDLVRTLVLPMSLVLILVEFVNRVRDGIAMTVFPFFATQELGISTVVYTQFTGVAGILAGLVGVAVGPFIDRSGAQRFLAFALCAAAACHFIVGLAPTLWDNMSFIVTMALLAEVCGQLVFVTIIALFMNLCWNKVSATQFAIYMSLANLSRSIGAWLFAPIADDLGFSEEFVLMGVLLAAAAGVLLFFNQASHARGLQRLKERSSPALATAD